MIQYNNINFGFIILNPLRDIWAQRSTARTILRTFNCDCLCVAPKDTNKEELTQMNEFCPTIKGGNTYTDLINRSLEKTKSPWNVIVIAGTTIRAGTTKKYHYFIESEKDILFPIVDKKYEFGEGSINGLVMHKNCIKEVGKFNNENDLELSKLAWADKAISLGYKFKAIAGVKIL